MIRGIFQKERMYLKWLIDHIKTVPEKCLDVGTGTGSTLDLLPGSQSIFCVDASFKMLEIVKEQKLPVHSIQANAIRLPFKNQKFQLISAIGLAEYVPDKKILLEEFTRCLTEDGYLCMTMAPPTILNRLRNLLGSRLYTISNAKWEEIVQQAGLEISKQTDSLLQRQYLLKKNEKVNQ